MNILLTIARKTRAKLLLRLFPKSGYFLFQSRPLHPISNKFGFDRGTPIDRYYIEEFVASHAELIQGRCLEIDNTEYTQKYGGGKVCRADALDINRDNKGATLYADLRSAPEIADNTFDCIILTHTLGVIDDFESAIRECYRILKPGGSIIVTVSAVGVAQDIRLAYWRFTETSMRYVFSKYFDPKQVEVRSYGNVLAGQAFWVGLAAEELTYEELEYEDSRYAVIVGLVAKK